MLVSSAAIRVSDPHTRLSRLSLAVFLPLPGLLPCRLVIELRLCGATFDLPTCPTCPTCLTGVHLLTCSNPPACSTG